MIVDTESKPEKNLPVEPVVVQKSSLLGMDHADHQEFKLNQKGNSCKKCTMDLSYYSR